MRAVIALALVLLIAPIAAANETDGEKARDADEVQPSITETASEEPELRLAPIVIEDRAPADESAAQDMPQRGSFWWIVGAIVVAGIILAVVL